MSRILTATAFLMVFGCLNGWTSERYDDLYKPTDLAVHANGEIYIADSGNHRIVVLDASLGEVRTFGRKGKGPGEFLRPAALAFLDNSQLLVADSEASQILVFHPQGTFQGIFLKENQSIGQLLVLPGKGILTTENDGESFSFRMGEEGANFPVRFYDLKGNFVKGLGTYKTHEIPFITALMNHGSLAAGENQVYFARLVENEWEVFEGETHKTSLYAPAYPPTKPDGKMVEQKQSDGSSSFQMQAQADSHCMDLIVLENGSLLMLRGKSPETDGIQPTELVILQPSGKVQTPLAGSYRAKRMALDKDGKTVLLIDEDDDGWFIRKVALPAR